MKRVWIVVGETGKGVDRQRWLVEAYDDESAANARVKQLTNLLFDMAGLDGHWRYEVRRDREDAIRSHSEGDPKCVIDSTGSIYTTETCLLHGTRSRQAAERLAVLALAVAFNVAILWAVWKCHPARVFQWLLK